MDVVLKDISGLGRGLTIRIPNLLGTSYSFFLTSNNNLKISGS